MRLTRREALVLANLHRPITLEQLAEELFVTRNTIKTQVRSVYRKLGVSGREAAVDRGRELALVPAREDLSQS